MKRLLPLLLLGGCQIFGGPPARPRPVPAYFADPRDTAPIRRVLVLPFTIEDDGDAEARLVHQAFTAEIQKTGRFEVMALPREAEEAWTSNEARKQGVFPMDVLLELGRRYRADGLVYGTITRFRAYRPPCLGLKLGMVSSHTGQVVWESDVFYDMGDATALADLHHYVDSVRAEETSSHDWEMAMISPRRFASYVCHRMVDRWRVVDASFR